MTPYRLFSSLLLAAGLTTALPAFSAVEVDIYRGEPVASTGIALGGWGSGYALQSQEEFLSGQNSIKLHTDGYYAGGRIDFTKPVDLSDAFADPNAYLVLQVRFPALAEYDEFEPGFGAGRAAPGVPPGIAPGVPPGGPSGGASGEAATGPAMGYFRIIAEVGGIRLVAEDQPIDITRTDAGWTTLSVPLSAFKGPRPASGNAPLNRLFIFGDRPDTFYIGEIRTQIDDEPMDLDLYPDEQTIAPNDLVQFNTQAMAGLANVEYIWDFDKEDGLQEDDFGSSVLRSWTDPGEYVVTLRVRDINNVKPEFRLEIPVTIIQ